MFRTVYPDGLLMLNWNLAVILQLISVLTKNVLYNFSMAVVIRPGFAVARGEGTTFAFLRSSYVHVAPAECAFRSKTGGLSLFVYVKRKE